MATPRPRARGQRARGSRTSPASLATSQKPPNEKNAATMPPARPASSGGEPGRGSTNGRKCDHVAAAGGEAEDHDHRQQHQLDHGQHAQQARAQPHARATFTRAEAQDHGHGHGLAGPRAESGTRYGDVLGEPGGERRGEAGIHHQQALPAVEEREARAPGLAQVDVAAAGLRIARGQLAVAERAAQRGRAHRQPDQQHRRTASPAPWPSRRE